MSDRAADVARLRGALASNPDDAVSWHNLAAAEGDLGRAIESEAAARRALSLGIGAPETRLVLGRALQSLGRLDEAQRMFLAAVELRPAYAEAHRDLAQLLWMRSADANVATRHLEESLRVSREPVLQLVKSIVLEFAGDLGAALQAAEAGLAMAPQETTLLRQAAHLCAATGHPARAVELASRCASLAPEEAQAQITLCEALLAAGRAGEAERAASRLLEAYPHDQHAIALQATAWRLLGDSRYEELHDYASLVGCEELDAPSGWNARGEFLRALEQELTALHCFETHPLQQSVRGGSQLPLQAREMARRPIAALFESIDAAVRRYLRRLGSGSGPLRSLNTGRVAITGAWSVRLRSGGSHADHVHPRGWLSSACYVALPAGVTEASAGPGRHAGWLRLGRPGIATVPPLAPDHFVKPEAGMLVLFPAYMWHGVEAFASDEPRLSVAFDALPA